MGVAEDVNRIFNVGWPFPYLEGLLDSSHKQVLREGVMQEAEMLIFPVLVAYEDVCQAAGCTAVTADRSVWCLAKNEDRPCRAYGRSGLSDEMDERNGIDRLSDCMSHKDLVTGNKCEWDGDAYKSAGIGCFGSEGKMTITTSTITTTVHVKTDTTTTSTRPKKITIKHKPTSETTLKTSSTLTTFTTTSATTSKLLMSTTQHVATPSEAKTRSWLNPLCQPGSSATKIQMLDFCGDSPVETVDPMETTIGNKGYYFTIPVRMLSPNVCTNSDDDTPRTVSCINTNPLCVTTTCTNSREKMETIIQLVMKAKFHEDGSEAVDPRTCYVDGAYIESDCTAHFKVPQLTFLVDWGMSGWFDGGRQRRMIPPAPRWITFTVAVGTNTVADARTVRAIYDSVPAITNLTSSFKTEMLGSKVNAFVAASTSSLFLVLVGSASDKTQQVNRAQFAILDDEFGRNPQADNSMEYDNSGTPLELKDVENSGDDTGPHQVWYSGTKLNSDCDTMIQSIRSISAREYYSADSKAKLRTMQDTAIQTRLDIVTLLKKLDSMIDQLEQNHMVASNQYRTQSFDDSRSLASELTQARAAKAILTSELKKVTNLIETEFGQAMQTLSVREKSKNTKGKKDGVSIGLPIALVVLLAAGVVLFLVFHNRRSPKLNNLTHSLISNGAYEAYNPLSLNGDTDA
jgi:hypothetical protein